MEMKPPVIAVEMNLKNIIAESREVAQALNEFADYLEQIEKKYAEPEVKEAVEMEQEPVLDKIRSEIEQLPKTYPFVDHQDMYVKEEDVLQIIAKYMAESEE